MPSFDDDRALLAAFVAGRAPRAFDALVARHVDWIYTTCQRELRDAQLAEDATQAAFLILFRKASSLGPRVRLSGWLFRTARYVSANAKKMQRRREHHERRAAMREG